MGGRHIPGYYCSLLCSGAVCRMDSDRRKVGPFGHCHSAGAYQWHECDSKWLNQRAGFSRAGRAARAAHSTTHSSGGIWCSGKYRKANVQHSSLDSGLLRRIDFCFCNRPILSNQAKGVTCTPACLQARKMGGGTLPIHTDCTCQYIQHASWHYVTWSARHG